MIVVTFNHAPFGGAVVFADACCVWRYNGAGLALRPTMTFVVEGLMREAVRVAHHLRPEGQLRVEL